MASGVYSNFKLQLEQKTFGLTTDTINMMLVNGYTFSAAHVHRSDITNETTGTGYSAGGQALSGLQVSASGANSLWTATNPQWAGSTITATGAVIYKVVGSAATDLLICFLDFGGSVSTTSSVFTVQIDPVNGIMMLS